MKKGYWYIGGICKSFSNVSHCISFLWDNNLDVVREVRYFNGVIVDSGDNAKVLFNMKRTTASMLEVLLGTQ
eukprot:8114190-Ditylum_brightwellii.AAC.1